MLIIPVVDLMGGQVVHARRGERNRYAPLQTPLAPAADPVAVVAGLLRLAPFPRLYVADLDAIQQQGNQLALLATWMARFPHTGWWVDGGFRDRAAVDQAVRQLRQCTAADPLPVEWVIGSETASLPALPATDDWILSLDFDASGFRGDPRLLDNPACWPSRVIVMTLCQVGSMAGPDLARIASVLRRAGNRQIYAAGGVRSAADLAALEHLGVAGALVATALHSGELNAALPATGN